MAGSPSSQSLSSTETPSGSWEWKNESCGQDACLDSYRASAALMRAVARVVPRLEQWRIGWTWADFQALLEGAGPPGQALWASVAAGVDSQRGALSDEGPTRQDAVQVEVRGAGGIHLPEDGTRICAGLAAGPQAATVRLERVGSQSELPGLWVDMRRIEVDPNGGARIPSGGSIQLGAEHGATEVRVSGADLVADQRCVSGEGVTVVTRNRVDPEALRSFAAEAEVQWRAARALWGVQWRVELTIGEGDGYLDERLVPSELWVRWSRTDSPYAVALALARVTAARTLWQPSPALMEALARTLSPLPEGELPWVAMEEEDVSAWQVAAARCGWPAILEGRCEEGPSVGLRWARSQ